MLTRRELLKWGAVAGVGAALPWSLREGGVGGGWIEEDASAAPFVPGLSDPVAQPKFAVGAPNALDPGFKYAPSRGGRFYQVGISSVMHDAGLVTNPANQLMEVFAYGPPDAAATWPGRTFELSAGQPINIEWQNNLPSSGMAARHPIWTNAAGGFVRNVVDTSLHWCYSLPGFEQYSIDANGVPVVVHVHGGHSQYLRDGNPEYFFSPGYGVTGPRWSGPVYPYPNDQGAGSLWYHDHALGITRLNVYAGMAGFYFLRDDQDTGLPGNPLGVPAGPYELAYAIQDRMFTEDGKLFYPSFPDDPFYDDFISGEGAVLPPEIFPDGGPTALAEFFGDHMVVNGKIWPKADVEPRRYRIHLLNGCDSRFLIVKFRAAATPADEVGSGGDIPFTVIGSDQGIASTASAVTQLVIGPGERYDLLLDLDTRAGTRVIMENIGPDEPYGGQTDTDTTRPTGRIMAFDVAAAPVVASTPYSIPASAAWPGNANAVDRERKVALFEGTDEFGRLQPLLGTAEPATDAQGMPINWPDEPAYVNAGLTGQMEGSIAWHSPTTENPKLNSTEIWEIWNVTGDAHPIHLHLVNFEVIDRHEIDFGPGKTELIAQPVVQHNGTLGSGFRIVNPTKGAAAAPPLPTTPSVEDAPKDMVTALPEQVTRIKVTFDKPGRYVWHCHILSHEDHEMMRPLEVGAVRGRPSGRP